MFEVRSRVCELTETNLYVSLISQACIFSKYTIEFYWNVHAHQKSFH